MSEGRNRSPALPPAPIALTLGDPNGIGPEVALKATRVVEADGVRMVLVGDADVWAAQAARLGLGPVQAVAAADEAIEGALAVLGSGGAAGAAALPAGRATAEGGRLALAAVERAVDGCLAGEFSAVVTAPLSKEAIALAGSPHPGHTELLAERTGARRHAMMLVCERGLEAPLRVGLVTIHVPLREVAALVTAARVGGALATVAGALRRDWGIEAPRLALLGLNPHAGDGGVLGAEERDVLEPALAQSRADGLAVEGPFPADAFFGRGAWRGFDATVACYHDQGLAPFKALAMGGGVNVTCGLPIVRTSPDHGTAFDIAGKGVADPSSMIEAVRLAAELARRRSVGRRTED